MTKEDEKSHINKYLGVWRSDYTYHSTSLDKDLISVQYVRIYPRKNGIVAETIPEYNDSYMLCRFSVDDNIITGTWQQGSAPNGLYEGTTYHGAGQLILSKDGKHLKGLWVGYGRNMKVKSGPWNLSYKGSDESVLANTEKAAGQ